MNVEDSSNINQLSEKKDKENILIIKCFRVFIRCLCRLQFVSMPDVEKSCCKFFPRKNHDLQHDFVGFLNNPRLINGIRIKETL